MKTAVILLAIVLAVLACGCVANTPAAPPATAAAAAVPDLTGTWTGSSVGHHEETGFMAHNTSRFVITEQQGRAFTGVKQYTHADGTTGNESFSGVITRTSDIFIVDHEAGMMDGELIGPDEMELIYFDDSHPSKAIIITLTRQKS